MKRAIYVLFILLFSQQVKSQDRKFNTLISIGYFGHYLTHPGIKIGTQIDLKKWETEINRKRNTFTKRKDFFVSPQIGFYTHFQNHSGLLFNVDIGYQCLKTKHNFYSAFSLGLGYLAHFNSGTTYVLSEEGEINEKKWASRSYFLPTLNYEFGQKIKPEIGWYSKFSFGTKTPHNTLVSTELYLELGIKFNPFN